MPHGVYDKRIYNHFINNGDFTEIFTGCVNQPIKYSMQDVVASLKIMLVQSELIDTKQFLVSSVDPPYVEILFETWLTGGYNYDVINNALNQVKACDPIEPVGWQQGVYDKRIYNHFINNGDFTEIFSGCVNAPIKYSMQDVVASLKIMLVQSELIDGIQFKAKLISPESTTVLFENWLTGQYDYDVINKCLNSIINNNLTLKDWENDAYLFLYSDVKNAGIDPLVHYLTNGISEGRIYKPNGWDSAVYLKLNPDVAAAGAKPLLHWWEHGQYEGRPYLEGDIKEFQIIPALEDPDNCYFTTCRVNGNMQFATYKDGSYQSKIKDINGNVLESFNSESCFMIIPFKGSYNMSQEHGQYFTVDRGMIYRLINGVWKEVYRHPRWDIITEMYENPVDGYLYASGLKWGVPSDPAGIVRSLDGINWSLWFENKYEYRFFGMTSRPDGKLVIAGTSSGKDWDMDAKDCSPCVFEGGNNLIWRDDDHRGSGNWAVEYWHDDIYIGRCGDGAVVRLSDRKEVLTIPGCDAIHDLAVDRVTDTLYAFCNRPIEGSIVKASKDGNNWYTVGTLNMPCVIDGIWDDVDKTFYLTGGKFAGNGRVYKGIRGSK